MKDDLEKLILRQRPELDRVETIPMEAIWKGIIHQKKKQNQNRTIKVVSIAATVVMALGAMIWLYQSGAKEDISEETVIAESFPEWITEKDQYNQLIQEKKTDLHFASLSRNEHPELFNELNALDQFYDASIRDLILNEDKEAILKVLIKYHERQLQLLERLSYEIQKKNEYEKPRQDPVIY
jgi:phosphoserine aminotransferase